MNAVEYRNDGDDLSAKVVTATSIAISDALSAGGKPQIAEMVAVLDAERHKQLTCGQALMLFDERADTSAWARRQVVLDAVVRFLQRVQGCEQEVGDVLRRAYP